MRALFQGLYLSMFLLDGGLSCSSCRKEVPASPYSSLIWQEDGLSYSTPEVTVQAQAASHTVELTGYIRHDANNNPHTITLTVPDVIGTYAFSSTSAASATFELGTGTTTDTYHAGPKAGTLIGSGTIVVSGITAAAISGTFTFTGQHTNSGTLKSITAGKFNAYL